MDLNQALETLQIVKEVFEEQEVKFTLAAGSLLGAVREGRFMGWDYDTDLSCMDSDSGLIPSLAATLNGRGVTVYYSEAFRCIAVYHKGVTIDIDFWRRDGDDLTMPLRFAWNNAGKIIYFLEWVLLHVSTGGIRQNSQNLVKFGALRYALCRITGALPFWLKKALGLLLRRLARYTGNPRGLVRVPASCFSSLSVVHFNGSQFFAPGDVDKYLTNRYGPNWRTPQKGWVYYDKQGNIFSQSQVPDGDWEFLKFPTATY